MTKMRTTSTKHTLTSGVPNTPLVFTKVHDSPLVPRFFLRPDMVSCYDVRNSKVTGAVLHILVDDIEGGTQEILKALPADRQRIPGARTVPATQEFKMPKITLKQPALELPDPEPEMLPDANAMDMLNLM